MEWWSTGACVLCVLTNCDTSVVRTACLCVFSIIPFSCISGVTCAYTLGLLVDYALAFAQGSKVLRMYCDLYVFYIFTFTIHPLRCTVVCLCNARLYVLCCTGGHKEKGAQSQQ